MTAGERAKALWAGLVKLGHDTFDSWSEHKLVMRAAAMSYYFLVTLAPLALVLTYLVSRMVGSSDPADLMATANISDAGANAVTQITDVARSYSTQVGGSGPLISAGIALVGATVLLGNFTGTLDHIWGSEPSGEGPAYFLRKRLLGLASLFVVMIVGLVLAIFVGILSALLTAVERVVDTAIALPWSLDSLTGLGWPLSTLFVTILLSLAFTYLPRRPIRWHDTLIGALLTAGVYMIGQRALGIYLERSAVISAWGALGTFVALIIWIYYTMQVVLGGAELTRQLVLRAEARRGDRRATADAGVDDPDAASTTRS